MLRAGPRGRVAVRRVAVAVVIAMSVGVSSVLAASHEPSAATATVEVQDFAFSPTRVTIPVGGTVVWSIGTDPEQHTVTPAKVGAFEASGQLFDGDTYTLRFDAPGTYDYVCSLHPFMTGSVVVTSASPAASATTGPAASAPASVSPVPTEPVGPPSASLAPTEPVVVNGDQLPLVLGAALAVAVLIASALAWSRARRHPPA